MISKHISTVLKQKALHSFQAADKIKFRYFYFICVFTSFHQNPTDIRSPPFVKQLCIVKQHAWLSSLNLPVHPLFLDSALKNLIYFLLAILCVVVSIIIIIYLSVIYLFCCFI